MNTAITYEVWSGEQRFDKGLDKDVAIESMAFLSQIFPEKSFEIIEVTRRRMGE